MSIESNIINLLNSDLCAENDINNFLNEISDIFIPSSLEATVVNNEISSLLWKRIEGIFLSPLNPEIEESAAHVMIYLDIYCSMKGVSINKKNLELWLEKNRESCIFDYIEEILNNKPLKNLKKNENF